MSKRPHSEVKDKYEFPKSTVEANFYQTYLKPATGKKTLRDCACDAVWKWTDWIMDGHAHLEVRHVNLKLIATNDTGTWTWNEFALNSVVEEFEKDLEPEEYNSGPAYDRPDYIWFIENRFLWTTGLFTFEGRRVPTKTVTAVDLWTDIMCLLYIWNPNVGHCRVVAKLKEIL